MILELETLVLTRLVMTLNYSDSPDLDLLEASCCNCCCQCHCILLVWCSDSAASDYCSHWTELSWEEEWWD